MSRSQRYLRAGSVFGASAAGHVHGTGGTSKWWDSYDAAKAYFDKHGKLNDFPDRAWLSGIKAQKKRATFTSDQIHFLKQINCYRDKDLDNMRSEQLSPKMTAALELKHRLDDQDAKPLSLEELNSLKAHIQQYRRLFVSERWSESRAKLFGVDHGNYNATMFNLKSAIKNYSSEDECTPDEPS
jgi:hypothetical protein